MSSIFSGEGSSTHPVSTNQMLVGMGLIVASQAVQAAQLTFEDFFMVGGLLWLFWGGGAGVECVNISWLLNWTVSPTPHPTPRKH
jgi:hypothetical protein